MTQDNNKTKSILLIIEEMANTAGKRCGASDVVYTKLFSSMIDERFASESESLRSEAVVLARNFDYASASEIGLMDAELSSGGYCSRGLYSDTCPAGCFE